MIKDGKVKYKSNIKSTDSFVKGDNISYLIDY